MNTPAGNTEEYRFSGDELVDRIKELVHEGNIRRIIIKNEEGRALLEIPLTLGVVGAALLPVWAAIGAIAALAANYTVVVEKADGQNGEPGSEHATPTENASAGIRGNVEQPVGGTTRQAAVTNINIPYPQSADGHLWLAVGACRLRLVPGTTESWVTGTYDDPSGALPLQISQEGGTAKITQRQNISEMMRLFSGTPTLDLAVGNAGSYTLTLETGASECHLDLGGLPVTRLMVKQGAGKVDVNFSAPNPREMSVLDVSSGASSLELRNLANANLAALNIEGGAASYRLDFSGTLRRDAQVRVTTGVSSVEILVPASTAAKISSEATMGSVNTGDGFMRMEGGYWTKAAVDGKTPVLSVRTSVTLGSLQLRTT
jgi:Domain of unknown function (DUF4342)